jgi:hypothetical protein
VKGRKRECDRTVCNASYVRTRNTVRDATLRDLAGHARPARANNGLTDVCIRIRISASDACTKACVRKLSMSLVVHRESAENRARVTYPCVSDCFV